MAQDVVSWEEFEQTKGFQAMPEIEKAQAQQSYFNEVVAPQVEPDQLESARKAFLNEYPRVRVRRRNTRSSVVSQKAKDIVEISRIIGIDPKQIDVDSGAKFLDRLDYSFSDTDEEVAKKFGQKYPDGTMARVKMPSSETRLVFQETSDDKWTTVEDYGASLGDIADLGAEATMLGASALAGAATGGLSIGIQMLAYGGGYAGSYLVKEGVEEVRGTQLQSAPEVGKEALYRFGEAAAGVGVAAAGAKAATFFGQRGVAGLTGKVERSQLVNDVMKAKQAGAEFESLMVQQEVPESMVISRIGAQAMSLSKQGQEKMARQQGSARLVLDKAKGTEFTEYGAGKKVLAENTKIYNKEYNRLVNELGRATPRQSEAALQKSVEDFIENTKKEITQLYKTTDDIAAVERPIFDLTPALKTTSKIRSAVVGEGKDVEKLITKEPTGGYGFVKEATQESTTVPGPGVQVADTPKGELVGILDKIDRLKGVQLNYEVVKQLRTQAGDMIEKFAWDANFNRGQAKRLYGALTNVLENPTNGAKNFVKAQKIASSKAKARFDVMDKAAIQQIVKMESSGSLMASLSKPGALKPSMMGVLRSRFVNKDDFKRFKTGTLDQIILDEDGAFKAMEQYRKSDPEGWRFLVPKNEEKKIENIARELDKLNRSNIGQLKNSEVRALNAVDNLLLKEGTSKADINAIVNAFSGEGRAALRLASFENIITKSSIDLKSVQSIDKVRLGKEIERYKKSGIWDRVLTKEDRIKIQGLKSYLDLIFWRGADPGVSLEAAQAITNLKHPATFLNGVHQIGINKIMAKVLMSKSGSKLMLGSPKVRVRKEPMIVLEALIKGLAEGTEPGSGIAADEKKLTP